MELVENFNNSHISNKNHHSNTATSCSKSGADHALNSSYFAVKCPNSVSSANSNHNREGFASLLARDLANSKTVNEGTLNNDYNSTADNDSSVTPKYHSHTSNEAVFLMV